MARGGSFLSAFGIGTLVMLAGVYLYNRFSGKNIADLGKPS